MHQENQKRVHTNADMSHQKTLTFKLKLFLDALRTQGLWATLRKIGRQLYYKIKGVDFSTQNIYDLTLTGPHVKHGTALVSSSKDFFMRVLGELEEAAGKRIPKKGFIDYGSGKGAALVHAREAGFEKVYGVEFAKELHDIAVQNIERLGLDDIYLYHEDASCFAPPPETTLIYFFNPFDEVVMQKVVEKIEKSDFLSDEVYIIYGRATCSEILDSAFTRLAVKKHESGAVVNYYRL
jgi:protein-L-isoaspartate O-methyltransferase